jgi:hypothetical protein
LGSGCDQKQTTIAHGETRAHLSRQPRRIGMGRWPSRRTVIPAQPSVIVWLTSYGGHVLTIVITNFQVLSLPIVPDRFSVSASRNCEHGRTRNTHDLINSSTLVVTYEATTRRAVTQVACHLSWKVCLSSPNKPKESKKWPLLLFSSVVFAVRSAPSLIRTL